MDDALFPDELIPAAPAGAKGGADYQVLARKYRPTSFDDMIGQEAMVRTLRHAFESGRIAHAFMLTGVRGVGKTTTARLLARALNYAREGSSRPSIALDPTGEHCAAIMASRHPDVIEMDAASHTGVDQMRELLEGARYAPVQARYKVYIIDEVHMLSNSAFNALLKTLEEPPPHVKFIFATTEIRKVPVTVLSRCQRFDLKRVDAAALADHLSRIADKEGAKISVGALRLIARAAEGSVRDALSLLDQAILQTDAGEEVQPARVRDMLGLADRARVLDLFEAAAKGDAKSAITELRSQYDVGADPAVIVADLLQYAHELSRAQVLGESADFDLAPDQAQRLSALARELSTGALARIWQMLLKGHEETRRAPDPLAAAEMTLIRLAVAAGLPSPEEAAAMLRDGAASASSRGAAPESGGGAVAQLRAQGDSGAAPEPDYEPQIEPAQASLASAPTSFVEAAALLERARDLSLKSDLERFARPVSFKPGRIMFQPLEGAPPNLGQRLSKKLAELTGQAWAVGADENAKGGETLNERAIRLAAEARADALATAPARALTELFPGAKLVEVRPRPKAQILKADFTRTGGADGEDASEDGPG
jgi:DNA polymerase-3 subunit gamma/tau